MTAAPLTISGQFYEDHGASITAQAVDLVGDGHGRHVPGTPDVYRHEWIPLDGTEMGKDGIRRPAKETAKGAVATAPPRSDSALPRLADMLPVLKEQYYHVPGPDEPWDGSPQLKAIARKFEGTFGGLHAKVTSISYQPGDDSIHVYGEVHGPKDRYHPDQAGKVGDFHRIIFPGYMDPSPAAGDDSFGVSHENLDLARHVQGRGFATEFNKNAEENVYKPLGIDHISVNADIDVGGYAWARRGFDWATPDDAEAVLRRIERKAGEDDSRRAVKPDPADLADIAKIKARMDGDPWSNPDYPTPYEFSEIGKRPGRTEWAGKRGMLGSDWNGIRYLEGGQ